MTAHRGSVKMVVNTDTDAVVQEIEYTAYGEVVTDTNPGFQPFYYAGGMYDQDTTLIRFGARDYDPSTGSWIERDPIRFDGGMNLYGYVGGDPVNMIDVTGLAPGDIVFFSFGGGIEHVGFEIKHGKVIMLTESTAGASFNGAKNIREISISNYGGDVVAKAPSGITADKFTENLSKISSGLQKNYRSFNIAGTMCIDLVTAGLGSHFSTLKKEMQKDYRKNYKLYLRRIPEPNDPSIKMFWRRNWNYYTYFSNIGVLR